MGGVHVQSVAIVTSTISRDRSVKASHKDLYLVSSSSCAAASQFNLPPGWRKTGD